MIDTYLYMHMDIYFYVEKYWEILSISLQGLLFTMSIEFQ